MDLAKMPNTPSDSIAAQYENYSIYVLLSSLGALPGFHWGLFVPTATPNGHVWHATNREGGWKLSKGPSSNVPFSLNLVLAYNIGSISQSTWQICKNILDAVNADGKPSPHTGEEFTCRVWVKDAITELHNKQMIVLSEPLSQLEDTITKTASK